MSTAMNKNNQYGKSTVGLLLIIGDIISNDQRDQLCGHLKDAFKHVNSDQYHEINDLFNNLIHENEFQTDSQYRQIANTENGSTAGFLYLPSFHTLLNVLKDVFNTCYHVCIIFCGQQVDSNGALILSDSLFTTENFHSLFEGNTSYHLQDLQIILPFVSNQWTKLTTNYLQKHLEKVQINALSKETNQDNAFGQRFSERLIQVLNNESVSFDIYTKLISRNSSGTIAFDEPNLYILYGQQGEASLFGIRGFVVLINGGYSRIPSYWNLIRGLQNIDACILTHFDYDVFPGLQTIVHRKTTLSAHDEQLCKPDIGAIFLNHTQRTKLQSTLVPISASSTDKLVVNLSENIDQFLSNIKQLNIDTFNLIKHTIPTKQTIEPISLYRKIAYGALDLYVLHPTTSVAEDDKLITALQKIPIRDQQVSSSSMIPHHHWYSSCSLIVWTPSSKSNKDSSVRILYTGACPQTLVFEALNRVRHLGFLHESQQEQQTSRASNIKTTPSPHTSTSGKQSPQKPKASPPITNRAIPTTVQNKITKVPARSTISKPKVAQTPMGKSEKPGSTPSTKKAPTTASGSTRAISKDKKPPKSREPISKTSGKAKQVLNHTQKLKTHNDQKQQLKVEKQLQKAPDTRDDHEQKLTIENSQDEASTTHRDHEQKPEVRDKDESELETHHEHEEESVVENELEQNLQPEIDDEQLTESQNNQYEQSEEYEQSFLNDTEEQQSSADELNENNEPFEDNHDDAITRPDLIALAPDHNESLVASNSASPKDESKSQLSPQDPMTTSFVDGTSDVENPLIEEPDDHDDDEMEIIHHDASLSTKYSRPSIEDISPQGLPVEKDLHPKKPTVKKSNNSSHRVTGSSTSTNHANPSSSSSHQAKQTPSSSSSSGSIFNVDVAYIPYHGNEHYVDSEFFRRIRARYYILNAVQVSRLTLESLIEGKQQWNKTEHAPITLVPTFDGEQLRQFFVVNKNRLAELNINILPASTRCNVQYDNEGSPAQLLRFSSMYDTDEQ